MRHGFADPRIGIIALAPQRLRRRSMSATRCVLNDRQGISASALARAAEHRRRVRRARANPAIFASFLTTRAANMIGVGTG